MARREPIRHGVWVFGAGVVLLTVVATAVTWFPDSAAVVRNLRVLGLPVRRNEWSHVLGVAGIASLLGMFAGAVVGTRWGVRGALAVAPGGRQPVPAVEPMPAFVQAEPAPSEPEPAVLEPQLFTDEPEPEPGLVSAWAAPAVEPEETPPAPGPVAEPEPAASPWWTPATAAQAQAEPAVEEYAGYSEPVAPEPVTSEVVSPEPVSPEPVSAEAVSPEPLTPEPLTPEPPLPAPPSFWPLHEEEPLVGAEPASAPDEGWALPEVEVPYGFEEQPVPGEPAVGPPAEPAVPDPAAQSEGPPASGGFEAPPQPEPEPEVYQEAPDALPDSEEERRRQQEEAARAYERAREEQ